jgi:hypothetical protein
MKQRLYGTVHNLLNHVQSLNEILTKSTYRYLLNLLYVTQKMDKSATCYTDSLAGLLLIAISRPKLVKGVRKAGKVKVKLALDLAMLAQRGS